MITAFSALALAAASPFAPPLGVGPPVTGPRSRVLTLGTPHLAEFTRLKPAMLEPLITSLARFRPTIITIEGVSGEQCDLMSRAPKYKDVHETYCSDPGPAQKATGLTQQQAETASEATFDRFARPGAPAPTASDRRKLALNLLAANERGSAWVQWLRLAPSERIAADGLDPDMVKILDRAGRRANESYDLAAVLAARLGLERLYAVDDHTSDGALLHADKRYGAALNAHWARLNTHPRYAAYTKLSKGVVDSASLLRMYRHLNDPGTLTSQIRSDFGGALSDPRAAPYGRQYAAWWDVRNLRMAANVRATMVEHPGARVLNIVGASHRPWYDGWMRQMSDVEVVPVAPYLR